MSGLFWPPNPVGWRHFQPQISRSLECLPLTAIFFKKKNNPNSAQFCWSLEDTGFVLFCWQELHKVYIINTGKCKQKFGFDVTLLKRFVGKTDKYHSAWLTYKYKSKFKYIQIQIHNANTQTNTDTQRYVSTQLDTNMNTNRYKQTKIQRYICQYTLWL